MIAAMVKNKILDPHFLRRRNPNKENIAVDQQVTE
jgi:hypothetical protein